MPHAADEKFVRQAPAAGRAPLHADERREWVAVFGIVVAAVGARLLWIAATRHTFEDAFITFQFAKRLAAGQGFVYNAGEPIYGTTTPLFALLLAGWLRVFPGNVVAGARLLDLLATAGGLVLTWAVLREMGVSARGRLSALALLAVSERLWPFETGGMETPLVLLFMLAALYACLRGWPLRAGFAAGLLLWTRVDLATWLVALVVVHAWSKRTLPGRFLASAGLTYLPWLAFAWVRFGSVIPHTITAKWVHYSMGPHASSLAERTQTLLAALGPFRGPDPDAIAFWEVGLVCVTLLLAAWGAFEPAARRKLAVFWVFALLDASRLVLTGATFEERYFVPVLSVVLILAGLGFAEGVARFSGGRASGLVLGAAAAAASCGAAFCAVRSAAYSRDVQLYRHERTLTAIGTWLNAAAPRPSSVLLEPLGYAGYFADRRMIDDVGLVSPQVVGIARRVFANDTIEFTRALVSSLDPDYVVVHCDDARGVFPGPRPGGDKTARYAREAVFDGIALAPPDSPARRIARRCCYEVWGRGVRAGDPGAGAPRAAAIP